jgi:hypothetical protein
MLHPPWCMLRSTCQMLERSPARVGACQPRPTRTQAGWAL